MLFGDARTHQSAYQAPGEAPGTGTGQGGCQRAGNNQTQAGQGHRGTDGGNGADDGASGAPNCGADARAFHGLIAQIGIGRVIAKVGFAGFVRHQQVHIVFAVAAGMHRLVGFLGAAAVAEHAAHAAAVAVRRAGHGVGSAVGRILYTVNGATNYCAGSTGRGSALGSSTKVVAVGCPGSGVVARTLVAASRAVAHTGASVGGAVVGAGTGAGILRVVRIVGVHLEGGKMWKKDPAYWLIMVLNGASPAEVASCYASIFSVFRSTGRLG